MCVVIANAQADYQRDLALFGKVRMHCVSLQPGDGLLIYTRQAIAAQATTLQCAAAALQMSTYLQFQGGSNEAITTDLAVHSGSAAAWAEPLQLQALDNRIAVRSSTNLNTTLMSGTACTYVNHDYKAFSPGEALHS